MRQAVPLNDLNLDVHFYLCMKLSRSTLQWNESLPWKYTESSSVQSALPMDCTLPGRCIASAMMLNHPSWFLIDKLKLERDAHFS